MSDQDWYGFETWVKEDKIREIVAERQNCGPEDVEVMAYGGCICARRRIEQDGKKGGQEND